MIIRFPDVGGDEKDSRDCDLGGRIASAISCLKEDAASAAISFFLGASVWRCGCSLLTCVPTIGVGLSAEEEEAVDDCPTGFCD